MTVLAILQARMSSRRLPGKVLAPLVGRPMIQRQIERVRLAQTLDALVVATSNHSSDDPVAALCEEIGARCFRGPLNDVLGRFTGAVKALGPVEHVVRLTADCPLTDWTIIDRCVTVHRESGADCTSNVIRRTFPDGLDVEVVTWAALQVAAEEAHDAASREHVTPFIYAATDRFRVEHITQARDLSALRWTVDDKDDLDFVRAVYARLYPDQPNFGMAESLGLARWPGARPVGQTLEHDCPSRAAQSPVQAFRRCYLAVIEERLRSAFPSNSAVSIA